MYHATALRAQGLRIDTLCLLSRPRLAHKGKCNHTLRKTLLGLSRTFGNRYGNRYGNRNGNGKLLPNKHHHLCTIGNIKILERVTTAHGIVRQHAVQVYLYPYGSNGTQGASQRWQHRCKDTSRYVARTTAAAQELTTPHHTITPAQRGAGTRLA